MTEAHAKRVASAVRAEVARRKISQATLGEALGLSQMGVSRRINGAVEFSAAEILILSELLGVTVETLMPMEKSA